MNTDVHETQRMLQDIVDSIVLGFHLDESTAAFELVCTNEGTVPGARAFVRFQFQGVRQFKRAPGGYRELRSVGSTFVARDVQGTWLVQTVRREKPDHLRVVSISLGEAFGGIELRYEDVTCEVVHLYAKPKGVDEWDYFELGSDRPVDFYSPFGCAWAARR
jgi:hypothetical protein